MTTKPLIIRVVVCAAAVQLGRQELAGVHEKLLKRWRDRPSGACLQGPAPNHPRAALAEDRCRERRGRRRAHVARQVGIEKASTSESSSRCRY